MERECGDIAETSRGSAPIDCARRTGRVFDDLHMIGNGRAQSVDVGAQSEEMNGDDRPGLLRHPTHRIGNVDVAGRDIDVREHRCRAAVNDCVRRRDPGEARHDHLVARSHADGAERKMQRRGATRRRQGMRDTVPFGERRFEGGDLRTLGDPAGPEHLRDGSDFLPTDGRKCNRYFPRRTPRVAHDAPPNLAGGPLHDTSVITQIRFNLNDSTG